MNITDRMGGWMMAKQPSKPPAEMDPTSPVYEIGRKAAEGGRYTARINDYGSCWVEDVDGGYICACEDKEVGDKIAAALNAAKQPAEGVMVPRDLVTFLLGGSTLDGAWFGDPNPTGRGRLWWREKLRAALNAGDVRTADGIVGQED